MPSPSFCFYIWISRYRHHFHKSDRPTREFQKSKTYWKTTKLTENIIRERVNKLNNNNNTENKKNTIDPSTATLYIPRLSERLQRNSCMTQLSIRTKARNTIENLYTKIKYKVQIENRSKINCKNCHHLWDGTIQK